MSTANAPPAPARRCTAAPSPDSRPVIRTQQAVPPVAASSAARVFLTRYTGTLLPMATALVAAQLGWQLLAVSHGAAWHPWPAAAAGMSVWTVAMAAWLRHRGWRAGWMHLVVWLPILVLAAPAALGWLAPAGLVLWGPVSTMLAAALAMAAHPLAPAGHADAPSHP